MKKNGFKCLWLLFLLLSIPSCTRNNIADQKDTLVLALSSQPKTLDPRIATDANGMRMSELIFQSLVKIGPNLNIIGDAAESWTYQDLQYTFTLKENLKFTNGRKVLKEDIEYSFNQYTKEKNPFISAFKKIKAVEIYVKNKKTYVSVYLNQFSATFLGSDLPVLKILPKKESKELGEQFSSQPLGSGPFVFKSQTANEIVLEKREDNSQISFKRIIFKIVRDDLTRFQKMINGEIDIIQSELSYTKVKEIEKMSNKFYIYKYNGLSMNYLLLNLKKHQLQNKKTRQAIAYGLNRDEIIKYKLEGFADIATSVITPSNPFFNHTLQPTPFKKEKAKALLSPSALKTQYTLKTSSNPVAIANGRVIAQQLKEIGINVKLQSFDWGTFYGDIQKGNFDFATMRWVGVIDPDIYRIAFHSKEIPPGRNRGHYQNKALDKLLDTGRSISDKKQRIEHYKKIQEIVFNDLPIIPLWYNKEVSIVNKRVQGYSPWKNGSFSSILNCKK